jgi:integrase
VTEIEALHEAMPSHLRLAVLLATWCQLRRGEILGLRRCDIDLDNSTIAVEQSRTYRMNGKSFIKEPKSKASRRTLAVPIEMIAALSTHLSLYTVPESEALIFVGRDGKPLTANALQGSWERARESIGRKDLRLHDLRHTGLTLSAATGATTAELMHRAGHSSAAAALRYQHATEDRDRILATALGQLIKTVSSRP